MGSICYDLAIKLKTSFQHGIVEFINMKKMFKIYSEEQRIYTSYILQQIKKIMP